MSPTRSDYKYMPTQALKSLRSSKINRINKLRHQVRGWFGDQELRRLEQHVQWIDVELETRRLHRTLF